MCRRRRSSGGLTFLLGEMPLGDFGNPDDTAGGGRGETPWADCGNAAVN